ncbi:hypothetical protein [Bacillus paralicheniformis]|uniref:hypothetical protein n=2 Tax=Bacillus TaxID=1386 RepID=UPI001CC6B26F|nr:hypothetical protein [Bacillus paralicheniformis]UAY71986.1 hypothetical protein K8336_08085 [Bacillus paralicheniformis]
MTISNLVMPTGLQYTVNHEIGLQIKRNLGRGIHMSYQVYNSSLVGRRVLVKDDSSLASVVQDGSQVAVPFLAVRKDQEPNLVTVVKFDDVVILGEVQS